MTAVTTFVIVVAPFIVTAALAWLAHRSGSLRLNRDQFRVWAPMSGWFDDGVDADAWRIDHELDAIRARFSEHPAWPASGVLGERR